MPTCAEPLRLVPGPQGPAGSNGSNGSNGVDAFTTLSAAFTVPVIGLTATATVASTAWMVPSQPIYLQNGGVFYVASVTDGTHVVLTNPAAETANVAAGTVIPIASKLAPSGFKGPAGSGGAAGAGVSVTTKGDLQSHDGANPSRQGVGTDGQMMRARAAAGNGLDWFTALPNATAATDDNKIAIANCPLGTEKPAPIQYTLAKVTDTGAYQTVGGNARGVDAVDQQPARAGVAQVASGNNSTIAGGRNNTSSGQGSTVGGGEGNTSSNDDSVVSGGSSNLCSGLHGVVAGGASNTASGIHTTVGGGSNNTSTAENCTVAGGANNHATLNGASIGGGDGSTASGAWSTIAGGFNNAVSGNRAACLGGELNSVVGPDAVVLGSRNIAGVLAEFSAVIGGRQGRTDLYGQIAHSAGIFSTVGDAQTSEIIFKVETTNATANVEAFIGPASQRAVMWGFSSWAFHIMTVARNMATDLSGVWETKGGIKRSGGVISLIGVVSHALVSNDGEGWMIAGGVLVDADIANVSLRLRVTGAAATTIRWVATCRLTQVNY